MTQRTGANRLPILAAEIRKAHADVQDAAKLAAERAIACGHALLEAKDLVKHGEWLPWLREHCAMPPRTAQLYMQVAKSGQPAAVVAAVGLKGATEHVERFVYDPFAHCTEPEKTELLLFALFLATWLCVYPEEAVDHVCWIGRQGYRSADDALTGRPFIPGSDRLQQGSDEMISAWREYREANAALSFADIDRQLTELSRDVNAREHGGGVIRRRGRQRQKRSVAHLDCAP
jgi:hypothetical protein